MKTKLSPYTIASNCAVLTDIRDGINEIQDEMKRLVSEDKIVPSSTPGCQNYRLRGKILTVKTGSHE